MASKSLGPFPKTVRWREIVMRSGGDLELAESLLSRLTLLYESFVRDEVAIACVSFLVALPICTREDKALKALRDTFGIVVAGPSAEQLATALNVVVPRVHTVKIATLRTLEQIFEDDQGGSLFAGDPWEKWRTFDGSGFCDLARRFFANLNYVCFLEVLASAGLTVDSAQVERFAWEMSVITRAFSARWFNACARYEVPEPGSIKWYFGHCMGKLDLELCREATDWVEPTGNPWRRKRQPSTAIFGF